MKKLGAIFYIVLTILTAAVLTTLILWIRSGKALYLYLLLGSFAVYLFHLTFNFSRYGKEFKEHEKLHSAFLLLANHVETEVVYITYLGNEARLKRPSSYKKDYLIEFYCHGVEFNSLKRHLWYDLPQSEERKIRHFLLGGMDVPYSFLSGITNKTLFLQARFYQEAMDSPNFSDFLSKNKIVLYGESS